MAAKIPSNGVNLTDFTVSGTTPFVTIGDAGAEDAGIIFDGNAQDFYVALDDSADSLLIGVGASVGTTSCIVVDANGHVTKPLQPAFLVQKSSNQTDLAINTAVTITWDTERFDVNADFASNTFTAPVTGKYVLMVNLYMSDFDGAADYFQVDIFTSNRSMSRIDESSGTEDGYRGNPFSVLVDMDANDTAYVRIQQGSGAAQANITTSSHFMGYLAC